MSSSLLKVFAGLAIGGSVATVGVMLNKSNNPSSQTPPPATNVNRASSPTTQDPEEEKFENCLKDNLNFKVTKNGTNETFTVPLSKIPDYYDKDGWTVENLYKNQCRKTVEDDTQDSGQHN